MNIDELLDLIQTRRSVRRFGSRPVPEADLQRMLEAARWAPSAGNRQGYRLIVVTSRATIDTMGRAVERANRQLAERLQATRPGDHAELVAYTKNFEAFTSAPLVIAPIFRCAADLLATGSEAAAGSSEVSRAMIDTLSSVSAAIMNLLLAAQACGLNACWMTGPLVARDELDEVLSVPDGWSLAALIPVGTGDERPEPPKRRPLSALVRYAAAPEKGAEEDRR